MIYQFLFVIFFSLVSVHAVEVEDPCSGTTLPRMMVNLEGVLSSDVEEFFSENPDAVLEINCGKTTVLRLNKMPSCVRHLVVVGNYVREIRREFLAESSLETLDLQLAHVKIIGGGFLRYCDRLKRVDLSKLGEVREVDDGFLQCCTSLETVNLNGLKSIVDTPPYFLHVCSGLTIVELSGFNRVQRIRGFFFVDCTGLEKITLKGFEDCQCIGPNFLDGCENLREINIIGFQQLQSIRAKFCSLCPHLRVINVSVAIEDIIRQALPLDIRDQVMIKRVVPTTRY